jgi:hypothetical protein
MAEERIPMTVTFDDWKYLLLQSAGSASPPVLQMGDYVLELFWKDGCEPTMTAMMDYAQNGLCRSYDIQASSVHVATSTARKEAQQP